MSEDNVVTLRSHNFLTEEQARALRDQGLTTAQPEQRPDFDTLDIDPADPMEHIMGTLTNSERELFVDYHLTFLDLDALRRRIGGDFYQHVTDTVRSGRTDDKSFVLENHLSEEDGRELHRLWRKAEALKNVLYWQLGERFDAHEYVIGVRAHGKVVRGKRKY